MNQNYTPRELTRGESRAIKALVTALCANYDKKYDECLILNSRCYMLGKCYTGSCCQYFRRAVLPLDPQLERQLSDDLGQVFSEKRDNGAYQYCETCGLPFLPVIGHEKYCSLKCAKARGVIKSREYKATRTRRRRKKYARPEKKWLCG